MLPARGFPGAGGGAELAVEGPPEWRGTTPQVCGLWPFVTGAGAPVIGVPLGRHLRTGATVCADPINWFTRARLLNNPSGMMFGLPALGKSSLSRRTVLGLAGQGVVPMIFGDLKGEYLDLVEALGGNVIRLGRGRGVLNPLDMSAGQTAAAEVGGRLGGELLEDERARVFHAVAGLIAINRRSPISDNEETILEVALETLEDRHPPGEATIGDLHRLLEEGPPEIRDVTLDRGVDERYREAVDPLERSLLALTRGALGESFAHRTTTPLDLSKPLAIDISSISDSDAKLQAAVLLTCWSSGFGAIEAQQLLADAGHAPRRHFFVVMDELWRVVQAGAGLVARIDAVTRLNRTKGVGQLMITHTVKDMMALPTQEDRQRALGFIERAGMLYLLGLPPRELVELREYVGLSRQEADLVTGWSAPAGLGEDLQVDAPPPGRGKALIKVGRSPGIPVQVLLTPTEIGLNNTNKRWADTAEHTE